MDIHQANQLVHGLLAKSGQYDQSPHFLTENIDRVRHIFTQYLDLVGLNSIDLFKSCLDLGCGTGFMYEVLKVFDIGSYAGIDITEEMLQSFIKKYPNINVTRCAAEHTLYESSTFSSVVNYSFLDHLENPVQIFHEAYRVLESGGTFYSGLLPNSLFSQNIALARSHSFKCSKFSLESSLEREFAAMFDNGTVYSENYGMDPKILELAEPQKTQNQGFDPNSLAQQLLDVGFKSTYVFPNWFFAQSIYGKDIDQLHKICSYLEECGPVSLPLFKYFDVFAIK